VQELLLVPELPEPRRPARLDAARGLEIVEIVGAEAAAVDLQGARLHGAALPAQRLAGVEAQPHGGEPVIVGALMDAAGDVAQHLADLLQAEGDAVAPERRAQAPHVAEQRVARPEIGRGGLLRQGGAGPKAGREPGRRTHCPLHAHHPPLLSPDHAVSSPTGTT
jgi:hypothetical protein